MKSVWLVVVVAAVVATNVGASAEDCAKDLVVECQKTALGACVKSVREIKVGSLYKHYSGKIYRVIAIAHDSEDPSLMRVVYQGLYDCPTFGANPVWDRPYTMFAENVIINGKEQPRFYDVT